jgi:hypothetical protein
VTSTKTTLTQHHAGSRPKTLLIAGTLKPAPAAGGEHMVVKTAAFGSTLYNSPTTGVCKIVAKYRGDDTYAASKAVGRVACRTGQSV